ncbi:MAG TPA: PHP-associated domain-containing protein [Candidatus Bilamarchaeaceae archaeon]|nr:PHP-associated domain-containing protein [Candidatus Bilamarchaeaceae archaeon]
MRIDFHVHTSHSFDGRISPEELASLSKKTGIIPAIADHNTISAHPEFRKFQIPFIPAEEVETAQGDLIGLFITEPVKKGVDFYEALDSFRSQGAIPYIPHMFDSLRPGLVKEEYGKAADIIEVFNARSLERFDKKAEEFARREGKLMAAGSDSHYPYEFGTTYTELDLTPDQLQPKPLLKALKTAKIVGKRTSLLKRKIAKYFKIYI